MHLKQYSHSSYSGNKQYENVISDNDKFSFEKKRENSHATLKLVQKLCKTLEKEGIRYCHWKSNAALSRSASGDNDLDLLVSRSDAQRFTQILYQLEFKNAIIPVSETQMPGVLDYYGFDEDSGRLIHVHVHYQLILGHDRTKNYCLPIEEPFIATATKENLFRVPTPEFEFIVFTVRMILKHSTWDSILGRQGLLSSSEKQELVYLVSKVEWSKINHCLNEFLPYFNNVLFEDCVQAIQSDCKIWFRIKVGQTLQRRLQAHARIPMAFDTYLRIWKRFIRAVRRRIPGRLPKKRLAQGGAIIALVGGDGAGKSTAIIELFHWLSRYFDTIKVHLGRPSWSFRTYFVRGMLKGIYSLDKFLRPKRFLSNNNQTKSRNSGRYYEIFRHLSTARDRYLTYVKARRFAINGGLVICDRFPQPNIKLMDSPQIEQYADRNSKNRLFKYLANRERKWYSSIKAPDMLIVLKVDPEIAVQRKTTEESTLVRARSREIWQLNWEETSAIVIDAGRPKEDVLSEIKSLVWSLL